MIKTSVLDYLFVFRRSVILKIPIFHLASYQYDLIFIFALPTTAGCISSTPFQFKSELWTYK